MRGNVTPQCGRSFEIYQPIHDLPGIVAGLSGSRFICSVDYSADILTAGSSEKIAYRCFFPIICVLETVLKDLKVVVCSEKTSPQGTTRMVPRPQDIRAISLDWNAAPWSIPVTNSFSNSKQERRMGSCFAYCEDWQLRRRTTKYYRGLLRRNFNEHCANNQPNPIRSPRIPIHYDCIL